jgi:hypothetical protein
MYLPIKKNCVNIFRIEEVIAKIRLVKNTIIDFTHVN